MSIHDQLLFEKNRKQLRTSYTKSEKSNETLPDNFLRKKQPFLPERSELSTIRHFTHLAHKNFSIDTQFYPLGSCTMKYNPRFTEQIAGNPAFTLQHPILAITDSSFDSIQGSLALIYNLENLLSEICGMAAFTTQPMAGAHGEFAGILLIAEYHASKGNNKKNIVVPDSSHGTNPASANVAGYDVITIPSLSNGEVDTDALQEAVTEETAAIMLTCPNTHGLFETRIKDMAEIAHNKDALLYYDGANLNAILGKVRPGDLGFDVVHVNVHKTFATPHGGGGPGAGPIGVTKKLIDFLPNPKITKSDERYELAEYKNSIGKIAPFFGNFGILVRTYAYIRMLGKSGLTDVSEKALLTANYLAAKLKNHYKLQFDRLCMHEAVLTLTDKQKESGVKTIDIAKFLIDKGVHAPTVYFPLTVSEAMMIEPTETEPQEELDNFIDLMIDAAKLIEENPEILKKSPQNLPIKRPDEVKAARKANVRWELSTGE